VATGLDSNLQKPKQVGKMPENLRSFNFQAVMTLFCKFLEKFQHNPQMSSLSLEFFDEDSAGP